MSSQEYGSLEIDVNRACDAHGPGLMPEPAAPKTREELVFEIHFLDGQIDKLKEQLEELNTEPIRKAARDLLDLCRTDDDDDDAAFADAFALLLRAANVKDDWTDKNSIHPQGALRVLVEQFGVEKVRDWTRQVAKSR
jgi:hypothetical protein